MDERKIDVLLVAIRLFSEKGYHSTSVEEIAKESGMAKGSFYKLFHSKEDLLFEIFAIIPDQMKKDLTNIYSKEYETPLAKLIDFTTVSMENILSHQVHVLSNVIFELPLFKNKKMLETSREIHLEMNGLLREFFIDLYGDKIQDYIWDLILLQRGLTMQYMFLYRDQQSKLDVKQMSIFMATTIDIVAEGFVARKPKSVIDGKYPVDCLMSDNSPFVKGQRIHQLFTHMAHTIKDVEQGTKEQAEYQETISLLEEACRQKEPKTYLVKALIHYLRNLPELEEDCLELMELLEIE